MKVIITRMQTTFQKMKCIFNKLQARRNRGTEGGLQPHPTPHPQIFAKVKLLPIGNDSVKKKITTKKKKLLQIIQKLMVTFLLSTSFNEYN